ncbi:hypothetical protein [Amycolatopsis stemonae]
MSARYEFAEGGTVEVGFTPVAEIDENLHGQAIVIGDPQATAFVVCGTVAELARFATAVTRAVTAAALHVEGRRR